MRTKLDPDDEFSIPEFDFSRGTRPSRFIRKPGEKSEICIDGAVGYSLRLIPSNKILARFESTLDAWPEIIRTIEAGRSPRTLSLDWNAADGSSGIISAGPRLEPFARVSNGELDSYLSPASRASRKRVAEGVA
jgi:hypothetical protein